MTSKKFIPAMSEMLYRTHFPYCLKKIKSGRWVILNREYWPLGTTKVKNGFSTNHDNLSNEFTFEFDIDKLDVSNFIVADDSNIFLYNDATNPINGGKALSDYLEKMSLLMKLKAW